MPRLRADELILLAETCVCGVKLSLELWFGLCSLSFFIVLDYGLIAEFWLRFGCTLHAKAPAVLGAAGALEG